MTTREKVTIAIYKALQNPHNVCYKVQDEASGTEWLIAANKVAHSVWITALCWPVEFCFKAGNDVNHLADAVTEQIRITTSYWKEEGRCRQELP